MLKMYKYESQEAGPFFMEAEVEDKADALLFQKFFRDAIEVNNCSESTFGLDKNFKEVIAMKYPFNQRFRLVYATTSKGGSISLFIVGQQETA
jgi:hypothetical protein